MKTLIKTGVAVIFLLIAGVGFSQVQPVPKPEINKDIKRTSKPADQKKSPVAEPARKNATMPVRKASPQKAKVNKVTK